MALRKIKKRYYIYYRDQDGKLRTLSLGTSDPAKAQLEHDRMMAIVQSAKVASKLLNRHAMLFPESVAKEMEQNNPIPPRIPREKKRLKLTDMVELARRHRHITKRSEKDFMRFVNQSHCKYADEVTPKIIQTYLDARYCKGNGKTYNNQKSIINTIFRCCLVQANMEVSPATKVVNRLVRDENVVHYRNLSEEEFLKAFYAAQEPWRTASLIGWHTALRAETCFKLAWEHISIENDIPAITVMPGKTARYGREVYIPIHAELWAWLKKLPRPKDDKTPILSQYPKRRNWKGGTPTYFVGLLKSLGIYDSKVGKASFHSLRASFITRCDEKQIVRSATRGVVGQIDDQITDLYSHDKVNARKILTLPAAGIDAKCM